MSAFSPVAHTTSTVTLLRLISLTSYTTHHNWTKMKLSRVHVSTGTQPAIKFSILSKVAYV